MGVSLALAMSGCAATSTTPDGPITINYWTHTNPSTQPLEKSLIAEYEKANPNVTINYLSVDFGTLPTKLNTAIAGGGGPDLFNVFGSYSPGLVAKQYLAPVDTDAFGVDGVAGLKDMFSEAAIDGFTVDGEAYGIPHETSSFAFWVNKKQFDAAGLDPKADFPQTYDDLATVGKKVMAAGATEGFVQSLYNPIREVLVLDTMAKQAGGGLFSADGKTAQLDSPEVVQALTTWSDFVHVSKINDPALGPTSSTLAENYFGDGTAATTNIGGSWLIPNLKKDYADVYANYTVGQYPTYGTNDVGGDLYGFALFVPVTSKVQAESWKFARFLSENGQKYFDEAGVWLGDAATLNSDATAASENWDVFVEASKRGTFLAPIVNYDELSQVVERAIQRVVLENQTPEESLKQAQSEAEPLME